MAVHVRYIDQSSDAPKKGRENLNGLPPHIARTRLPNGQRLADLSHADIARLCIVLGIPGAGHSNGKLQNCELLISTLEGIGQEAAERAIEAHLNAKLGGA